MVEELAAVHVRGEYFVDHLRLLTVPPFYVQYKHLLVLIGTVTVPLVITIIRIVILICTILIELYHAVIFYWYIWYSFGGNINDIYTALWLTPSDHLLVYSLFCFLLYQMYQ